MPLEPGPMQVIHNAFTTKEEVLEDLKRLDLWPTTYVSERMEELPLHWHDVDNCGYVLDGPQLRAERARRALPARPR